MFSKTFPENARKRLFLSNNVEYSAPENVPNQEYSEIEYLE